MDVEAKARAIVEEAKRERTPLPRGVWWAALVVSAVCTIALVIGYVVSRDEVREMPGHSGTLPVASHTKVSPMFGGQFFMGVAAGIAIGIAIGSALALRKRS